MLDEPSDGSPLDHPAWHETEPSAEFAPEIGSQLGPYRIEALIGSGGMGTVFRATDTRLARTVAVKVSSEKFNRRFEGEAMAVSALNHPNICTLYDVGSLPSGAAYMVTEFIEGETLRVWMENSPSVDRALPVIHQLLDGLGGAHQAGIVHRDLKPANIMIRRDGYVKVLDFGLAKRVTGSDTHDSSGLSGSGRIVGTAAYMSPEQIRGQEVDRRSDLFAVGIILYEIVEGCHPWSAPGKSTVDVMHAILHDELPRTRATEGLDRVIRRCLEKRPVDRFQSAVELSLALRKAAADGLSSLRQKQPSVAVLPFRNISADQENEYFSEGLAEEIINELASVPGIKVAARTSSFFFEGKDVEFKEIGSRLQVDHILEGGVRKAGNHLRITAQLVKVSDGFPLWSGRFDRELTDIFAVQDEITRSIASALRVKLSPKPEAFARYRPSLRAYDAYLRARERWFHTTRPGSLGDFKGLLEQAIALDPKYALPHCFLGLYYSMQANLGFKGAHEVIPFAIAAEKQALSIDPDLPEAHAMMGVCVGQYEYDWNSAERHWRIAMAREPVPRDVMFWYGNHYLIPTGRTEEAVDAMERGLEGDPLNLLYRHNYARGLQLAGRTDQAESELRTILEIDSNHGRALGSLGLFYAQQGRFDEALPLTEKAHALMPESGLTSGQLAAILHRTGRNDRADLLYEELQRGPEEIAPIGLAMFQGLCGNIDEAAKWAARTIEQRYLPFVHNLSPFFRSTSLWPGLAKLMNLPA
jgi:serine/threonine-protein kinase